MNEGSVKNRVISGLFWKFLEKGGGQLIQLMISVVLARLLSPTDYGIVGIITVFITVATVFVQSGFSTSLIQKSKVNDLDYNSVFYFGLFVSVLCYLILFIVAPIIANYYDENLLEILIRVQSLTLIIGSFGCIQNTILTKRMEFKKTFMASLAGTIISGIVGILMAVFGFGVWSLVFSQIANTFFFVIVLWFAVDWKPKLEFSIVSIKSLFNFGSKLLISNLLDVIFNNIQPLIIGKFFSKKLLGFYNRGSNIPSMIVNNITASLSSVLFPAFSQYQDDTEKLKYLLRQSISCGCYIVFPMMFGLIVVAEPLTIIMLTDKWLESVKFMQFACLAFVFYPIHTANLQALIAKGRSDIFLKLEIVKKILIVISLVISIPIGIEAMMIANVIVSILSIFINSYPNRKLLGYTYKEQLYDIFPYLILSIAMGVVTLLVGNLNFNIYLNLLIQVIIGGGFYIFISYVFKIKIFRYLISSIRNR